MCVRLCVCADDMRACAALRNDLFSMLYSDFDVCLDVSFHTNPQIIRAPSSEALLDEGRVVLNAYKGQKTKRRPSFMHTLTGKTSDKANEEDAASLSAERRRVSFGPKHHAQSGFAPNQSPQTLLSDVEDVQTTQDDNNNDDDDNSNCLFCTT